MTCLPDYSRANVLKTESSSLSIVRNSQNIDKSVDILTETVTAALTRRIANGDMIHIEDIQDQVELALMRGEHHKVARAYVLYREQRAKQRYKTAQLKEQVGAKDIEMEKEKWTQSQEQVKEMADKAEEFIRKTLKEIE